VFILSDFRVPVPGDGGSQVEAKLHKERVVHYLCEKTTQDFFNIWLNMELLVPLVIDCWVSKQSHFSVSHIYFGCSNSQMNGSKLEA